MLNLRPVFDGKKAILYIVLAGVIGNLLSPGRAPAKSHSGKAAVTMEQMVVIGDKMDEFIRKNPSQVVSMDAREIEDRNFLQVQEVLGAMPGVDVRPSAGGLGTRIAIRGGGGSGSIIVLIDGRPAASMQYGGWNLSAIPIDIIEKITVFKPPVPIWLGPDSAAGAIYIELRSKKARNKEEKGGKVRVSGGSFGLATLSATGQVDTENSQFLLSGGVSRKDGRRDNSDKNQGHLSLGFDRKKEGRQLSVNAKAYLSDHGVAGPTYNPTPNASQRYEKGSFDIKYKGFAGDTDYTLKGWTDVRTLDETSQSGATSRLDTLTAGLGSDLFVLAGDEDDELRIGIQGEHSRVDHTRSGKHERNRASTHAELNIRTQPCVYTLGARADYTNDFNFSPGGHAGMVFFLSKATQIKINTGYTEHIPSFSQLYQPSHGAIDQVRGNPDLVKEKTVSSSVGLELEFGQRVRLSAAIFRSDSWDLIKYQRDSNAVSVPENISRAFKHGLETVLKVGFTKQTGVEVSYVLQDTENKDNSNALSYAPVHSGKLIFKTVLPTKTRLEWITRGYTKQYSDNANTDSERLEPYLTSDLKLTHPVGLWGKKAIVFANVHNLFDKDYASHYGYPDDGIKLEVGMSLSF